MPGPLIADPTPDWLKPENASVTDSALTKAMRMMAHVIGADNPSAQVFNWMTTELPGGEVQGGIAKAMEGLKGRVQNAIKAYHGSPHDFEQFSLSKIGTGEGAQAYGHGLYFAENPAVAADYRDTLAYLNDDESRQILDVLPKPFQGPDNVRGIVANIRKAVAAGDIEKPSQFAKDYDVGPHLQQAYEKAGALLDNKGKMYEVAIHADPEDFLDWDKPLKDQPAKVRDRVLKQLKPNRQERYMMSGGNWTPSAREEMTGKEAYQHIADRLKEEGTAGQLGASLDLRGKGKSPAIAGIKYLDQGSRGAGQGTSNYVVFDDKLIDIQKKYAALLAAGLSAEEAHRQATK